MVGLPSVLGSSSAQAVAPGYPTAPPARICGNAAVLSGPAVQPAGSTRIDPGQNLYTATAAAAAGTTFWLSPGTHTLGTDIYSQVMPKTANSYIGAPGAVIDGQGINRSAFTDTASNVSIRFLTITRFNSPLNEAVVNHNSGVGWTIEFNSIVENGGAAVMLGTNTYVHGNCLADNVQYGFSAYSPGGGHDIRLDGNEIARNNTGDIEATNPGCGCAGAGKFWDTTGAVITNNWVHDNHGPGLWADTNNVGFRIEGNYIENNDDEGIFYEISYNARIVNNTLKRNAIVKGRVWAAQGQNMPVGAIYISESGGDARVYSGVYSTLEIAGNYLEDNWGGVSLWENADRFCGSPANTSTGFCTLGGSANLDNCVPATIGNSPYLSDCRWKTKNVSVHDNQFHFSRINVGCTTDYCGQQAILANFGTYPTWSPYQARSVQDAVTSGQNNRFTNNTYVGDWLFTPYESRPQSFSAWQSAYSLDTGSTFAPGSGVTNAAAPVTTTTVPAGTNALDAASAGGEGSAGQWIPWFSANVSASSAQAHSGAGSVRVDVTAPNGWGIQQQNWPGFTTAAGAKTIGFWGMTASGPGLSVTMRANWRDSAGANLSTDVVTLALGATWAQATADVTAPPGTTRVSIDFSNSSGVAGTAIYIDDITASSAGSAPTATTVPPTTTTVPPTTTTVPPTTTTVPPTTTTGAPTTTVPPTTTTAPPTTTTTTMPTSTATTAMPTTTMPTTTTTVVPASTNALDANTASAEGSAGQWIPWFSANVSSSNVQAHTGGRSLRVDVTAPYGWGVQQQNWPGFTTGTEAKTIGFWGMTTSGSGLSVTMRVHWRDSSGADLRVDVLTLPLGATWAQATANVTPPAGTTRVSLDVSNSSGVAGTAIYLDDISVAGVVPPSTTTTTTVPASPNALDANSAGAEGSVGQWASWFSANVSSSNVQAHTGSRSLRVDVTAPHGWGVQQQNWPGFTAGPGARTIGFWGMTTSGSGLSVTMRVHWRDSSGADLRVDVLTLPVGATWAQATANVTAPSGTTRVSIDFSNSSGTAGTAIYLDDISVPA